MVAPAFVLRWFVIYGKRILCRCLLAALIAAAPAAVSAQAAASQMTASALRSLYGNPIGDRFSAGHGIDLVARYGEQHLVCAILLEPAGASVASADSNLKPILDEKAVTAVLGQLVPELGSKSGQEEPVSYTDTSAAGCDKDVVARYPGVWIEQHFNRCESSAPAKETYASVAFKSDACNGVPPPQDEPTWQFPENAIPAN
jgi:hypothetical protein